jgi:protoheme IX farnesyltransferase
MPVSQIEQPARIDALSGASVWRDYVELTKPGIVKMVAMSAGVGFIAAYALREWTTASLVIAIIGCLVGVVLSAAGANTLNQVWEVSRDARMQRTASRPIPSGAVSPTRGAVFGTALSAGGVLVLLLANGPAPALISLLTIVSYVLLYTPMKPITPLATVVGAVPGALPPLIGFAAASPGPWGGLAAPAGWSLFALMFLWQIPHFLAIAWKYREDYAKGGFAVLPVQDPDGTRTARAAFVWAAALLPVSLVPALCIDALGALYVVMTVIAGLGYLAACAKMLRGCDDRSARLVFVASIIYLPIVLLSLAVDALL